MADKKYIIDIDLLGNSLKNGKVVVTEGPDGGVRALIGNNQYLLLGYASDGVVSLGGMAAALNKVMNIYGGPQIVFQLKNGETMTLADEGLYAPTIRPGTSGSDNLGSNNSYWNHVFCRTIIIDQQNSNGIVFVNSQNGAQLELYGRVVSSNKALFLPVPVGVSEELATKEWVNRTFDPTKKDIDIDAIEVTNYMLFADTYTDKEWDSDSLIDSQGKNATSMVRLDLTQDIWPGTSGNTLVSFFEKDGSWLADITATASSGIAKADFPSGAYYVAFSYQRSQVLGDAFYASTRNPSFCQKLCSNTVKVRGSRPVINISTSDSEDGLFKKMVDAWFTRDCDVYFEPGIYVLNEDIFDMMANTYGWSGNLELPVGGNCRYFFQGSIFNGSYDGNPGVGTILSCFGTRKQSGQSFEMYDGIIHSKVNYSVNDDADGEDGAYRHVYKDMRFYTNTGYVSASRESIHGVIGMNGVVEIDGCLFGGTLSARPDDFSWNGKDDDETRRILLTVKNCIIPKGIGFGTLYSNEGGDVLVSGCKMQSVPYSPFRAWNVNTINIEIS